MSGAYKSIIKELPIKMFKAIISAFRPNENEQSMNVTISEAPLKQSSENSPEPRTSGIQPESGVPESPPKPSENQLGIGQENAQVIAPMITARSNQSSPRTLDEPQPGDERLEGSSSDLAKRVCSSSDDQSETPGAHGVSPAFRKGHIENIRAHEELLASVRVKHSEILVDRQVTLKSPTGEPYQIKRKESEEVSAQRIQAATPGQACQDDQETRHRVPRIMIPTTRSTPMKVSAKRWSADKDQPEQSFVKPNELADEMPIVRSQSEMTGTRPHLLSTRNSLASMSVRPASGEEERGTSVRDILNTDPANATRELSGAEESQCAAAGAGAAVTSESAQQGQFAVNSKSAPEGESAVNSKSAHEGECANSLTIVLPNGSEIDRSVYDALLRRRGTQCRKECDSSTEPFASDPLSIPSEAIVQHEKGSDTFRESDETGKSVLIVAAQTSSIKETSVSAVHIDSPHLTSTPLVVRIGRIESSEHRKDHAKSTPRVSERFVEPQRLKSRPVNPQPGSPERVETRRDVDCDADDEKQPSGAQSDASGEDTPCVVRPELEAHSKKGSAEQCEVPLVVKVLESDEDLAPKVPEIEIVEENPKVEEQLKSIEIVDENLEAGEHLSPLVPKEMETPQAQNKAPPSTQLDQVVDVESSADAERDHCREKSHCEQQVAVEAVDVDAEIYDPSLVNKRARSEQECGIEPEPSIQQERGIEPGTFVEPRNEAKSGTGGEVEADASSLQQNHQMHPEAETRVHPAASPALASNLELTEQNVTLISEQTSESEQSDFRNPFDNLSQTSANSPSETETEELVGEMCEAIDREREVVAVDHELVELIERNEPVKLAEKIENVADEPALSKIAASKLEENRVSDAPGLAVLQAEEWHVADAIQTLAAPALPSATLPSADEAKPQMDRKFAPLLGTLYEDDDSGSFDGQLAGDAVSPNDLVGDLLAPAGDAMRQVMDLSRGHLHKEWPQASPKKHRHKRVRSAEPEKLKDESADDLSRHTVMRLVGEFDNFSTVNSVVLRIDRATSIAEDECELQIPLNEQLKELQTKLNLLVTENARERFEHERIREQERNEFCSQLQGLSEVIKEIKLSKESLQATTAFLEAEYATVSKELQRSVQDYEALQINTKAIVTAADKKLESMTSKLSEAEAITERQKAELVEENCRLTAFAAAQVLELTENFRIMEDNYKQLRSDHAHMESKLAQSGKVRARLTKEVKELKEMYASAIDMLNQSKIALKEVSDSREEILEHHRKAQDRCQELKADLNRIGMERSDEVCEQLASQARFEAEIEKLRVKYDAERTELISKHKLEIFDLQNIIVQQQKRMQDLLASARFVR